MLLIVHNIITSASSECVELISCFTAAAKQSIDKGKDGQQE